MPCDSVVQKTQVTNADRLVAALEAEGHKVVMRSDTRVATSSGFDFQRGSVQTAFSLRGGQNATSVLRKYAEMGVRDFAKRRGYSIAREEGPRQRLVLTNRRGK